MSGIRAAALLGALAAAGAQAAPASAAFPGRNGRIAAVVDSRVVTVRADGSRLRRVAPTGTSVHWSADGRMLAVGLPCVRSGCGDNVGGPAGPSALRIVSTGWSRLVRTSAAFDFEAPLTPSWTPAGRLLWARHTPVEGGTSDIIVADRRARGQRVLALPVTAFGAMARAAPSGGAIAVAVWSPEAWLVVLPPGGATARIVVRCQSGQQQFCVGVTSLDWSPDASRIAFESRLPGAEPTIRIVDVATGAIQDVRSGTAPFWSPDGRRLASISPEGAIEIGPPGPGPVTTLPLRGVTSADWQPRRLSRRLDQPVPDRTARELDAIAHLELGQDVLAVTLDRAQADLQQRGDLLRRVRRAGGPTSTRKSLRASADSPAAPSLNLLAELVTERLRFRRKVTHRDTNAFAREIERRAVDRQSVG